MKIIGNVNEDKGKDHRDEYDDHDGIKYDVVVIDCYDIRTLPFPHLSIRYMMMAYMSKFV